MSSILNYLVDLSRNINSKFDLFFLGAQRMDTYFIIGFLVASFLISILLKRRKIILLAVAVYMVTALYQALPFDWALAYGNNVYIFLGAVLTIFFLLYATIAKGIYGGASNDHAGRIKMTLLSVITLGFLVSSALNFVTDVDVLSNIALVDKLFSGDISRGIWAGLPLLGFLLLRK
ncbi:MAG: hypothetical protein Q8Q95_02705 [bacterium]|nr:hypothetical protein [bacterium]